MALYGANSEEKIWNFLYSKGLNEYSCAGIMGNLYAESGLNPSNLQNTYEKKLGYTDAAYVAAVDSGEYSNFVRDSAGFGLAQWTYWSRKQGLLEYAKSKGESIGDLETQLEFLWKELTQSYKSLLTTLKKASSVREASDAVLLKYEKPANQGTSVQEKRASYGQKYYNKYAGNNKKGGAAVMDIITAYATKNDCYKSATPMTPKGIVVHSTGANNPNLKRYVDCVEECGVNQYGNHWNNSSAQMGRKVCVHSFIGYDKNKKVRVANILPYNYACWGVGEGKNGSFNYDPQGHIQFEMCEDDLTNKEYCKQVYDVAVEYAAYLCKKFGFDPMGKNVIVSHKEAHALGYGSNHGDPDNWWKKHGYTMDKFRAAVKAKMKGTSAGATAGGNTTSSSGSSSATSSSSIKAGDLVKIAANATYYSGKSIPSWVKNQNWYVASISGNRAVIDKNESGTNAINSPIHTKYLAVVDTSGGKSEASSSTGSQGRFKARMTAPAASNKYWVHTSKGGLNECIIINSATGSCLPNCVGYAWGRFYEITGKRPSLSKANAENWFGYTTDGYARSQTPSVGAVICWRKGKAGVSADGAGHVAIVEEVKSNGDIVTSNSDYGGTRFYTKTITKASGYSIGSAYTFQGFILPPGVNTPEGTTPASSNIDPYRVKVTASALNYRKGPGTNYAIAGVIRDKGVYTIVEESGGTGANKWGKLKSGVGWISLDYVEKV